MKIVLVTLVSLLVLSGCGDDYPRCVGVARFAGTAYVEIGFTDHLGPVLGGEVAVASCGAVRRVGVVGALAGTTRDVGARSLPGYPISQVVLVQVTDEAWGVLVAQDAPARVRRDIRRAGLLDAGEA